MANLRDIKALIIDMDGVLWRDNEPIVILSKLFDDIRDFPLKFVLATNNSTRSTKQYQQRLAELGAVVHQHEILTSGLATALVLRSRYPLGGNVFVVGETGLVETLSEHGFKHSTEKPLAVVAGLDRQINYEKLKLASGFIRNGAAFIATNPDKTLPTPNGFVPGAGAVLAFIEAATDTKPEVIGKPFPTLLNAAIEIMQVLPEQVLAIGDRLDTDIAGAQAAGCMTALVLSGVSTETEGLAWSPAIDLISPDISKVIDILHEHTDGR